LSARTQPVWSIPAQQLLTYLSGPMRLKARSPFLERGNAMMQTATEQPIRVGFFDSVAKAEEAVTRLLAAGFAKHQLAVICPPPFADQFKLNVPRAPQPGAHAAEAVVEGGAVGAAIGGIVLVATAIATGGAGLLLAGPVLVGGGALAGGFSNLILVDGYGNDIGEYYEEAVRLGRIVVGVKVEGEDSAAKLAQAEQILEEVQGEAKV